MFSDRNLGDALAALGQGQLQIEKMQGVLDSYTAGKSGKPWLAPFVDRANTIKDSQSQYFTLLFRSIALSAVARTAA